MIRVPTRICDLGGWTDTWFAGHGLVCHLAVWPGVDVSLHEDSGGIGVEVQVGARAWRWRPGLVPTDCPDPLIAATLDEAAPPEERGFLLRVEPGVPVGSSMGTSAAVCMAVLSAFDEHRGTSTPVAVQAARAHRVETVRLGWQSGVQDQFAAATGAAHLITVERYPHATCQRLPLGVDTRRRLDETLLVVFLGRGHSSSAAHDDVVRSLADAGSDDARLRELRALAAAGAVALECGDLVTYGRCLAANTEVQQRLHPSLVSADAHAVISHARQAGALGWKINGAGGDGGTVSLLCADTAQRAALSASFDTVVADARCLSVRLADDAR